MATPKEMLKTLDPEDDTLAPSSPPSLLSSLPTSDVEDENCESSGGDGLDLVCEGEDGELTVIPFPYLEKTLHSVGLKFFNRPIGAVCKLLVVGMTDPVDEKGGHYPREFWAHEEYLSMKSALFRKFFSDYYSSSSSSSSSNLDFKLVEDENGRWLQIRLALVKPELSRFEEILHWIYTGDDSRWFRQGFCLNNYKIVAFNCRLLGLNEKAMAICTAYHNAIVSFLKNLQLRKAYWESVVKHEQQSRGQPQSESPNRAEESGLLKEEETD